MTLVSTELKAGVQKALADWSAPGAETTRPTTAETKMIGPQTSEARWPAFTITSDEPKTFGGMDSAPSPSSFFAASIGFAENVVFARQAALYGVDFDSYETKIEVTWDRKGLLGIENIDPAITKVLIETRVKTGAPAAKIAELLKLTNQRCHVTSTVAKAAQIQRKLFVNGAEVAL